MKISDRAKKYLNHLIRNKEWFAELDFTSKYFENQGLLNNDILFDIQYKYSGYELSIKNTTGQNFDLLLFSNQDIMKNNNVDIYRHNEIYLLDFGHHETAPFNFYITNNGELCTFEEGYLNIFCSSVEKLIEQYALLNELSNLTEDKNYYGLLNIQKFEEVINKGFEVIDECSDNFSKWYFNGKKLIIRGTWFDSQENYLHIYGEHSESCQEIVSEFKLNKTI